VGNWSGPGCEVYIKPYFKKTLFLASWIWERFRSRFPFRNLKTAHDKAIKFTQINLIIIFNKYGKRLGGEVSDRYCYLS